MVMVKLQTLHRKFENFLMRDGDVLSYYISNMIDVVNQIRKYGEDLSKKKVVEKIIRSLPKKYDHVVAAIEESKHLSVLTFDELQGSLFTHEDRIKRYDDDYVENAFYNKMQLLLGEQSSQSNYKSCGGYSSQGIRGGKSGGHSNDQDQGSRSKDIEENRNPKQCYYYKK